MAIENIGNAVKAESKHYMKGKTAGVTAAAVGTGSAGLLGASYVVATQGTVAQAYGTDQINGNGTRASSDVASGLLGTVGAVGLAATGLLTHRATMKPQEFYIKHQPPVDPRAPQ